MCLSHVGYTLNHHRSTNIFPNTPCVSVVGWNPKCVHFCSLRCMFTHLGFEDAGVAPLPPRFRNFLNEAVKAITLLCRVHKFLIVTTNAKIVGSVKHERPSPQQMAKWRYLPGVVHWSLHVDLPRAPWYQGRFSLLLCHFCAGVLLTRLSARCLPSSRPDTASTRSCL